MPFGTAGGYKKTTWGGSILDADGGSNFKAD